jgi:hypothetical protein
MEIFHVIAPTLVQDLKCFYSDDRWQGKWYVRVLLVSEARKQVNLGVCTLSFTFCIFLDLFLQDQMFPKEAYGTKVLFEEEFMKYYGRADSKLSKYYGKLQMGPIASLASPGPEDLPDA